MNNLKDLTDMEMIDSQKDLREASIINSQKCVSKMLLGMTTMVNPFTFDFDSFGENRTPLMNIATGVVLENEFSDQLLDAKVMGKRVNSFIRERFIDGKFWHRKCKVNLPTFRSSNKIMKVPVGKDKQQSIKIDKQLFQRFLMVS